MSMSVGASSSNALSYLQRLLQQGTAGAGDATAATASDPLSMLMQEISGGGTPSGQTTAPQSTTATGPSGPPFSPDTMSALLSAQGQQSAGGPDARLFAKLDTDGDGTVSKDEFSAAASKAGADSAVADAVFNKIDSNGDGAVTQDELTKADKAGGHRHHHVHGGGASGAGGAQDPLEAMLSPADASGATTKTSTNADGSTTTTISYADGSKIDMTSPAASASAANASASKSSLLEQLIKLQSQALNLASSATSTLLAMA